MKVMIIKILSCCSLAAVIGLGLFYGVSAYQNQQFGYLVFGPFDENAVHIVDRSKTIVKTWQTDFPIKGQATFLDDGSIMKLDQIENQYIEAGGGAGQISTYNWDGDLTWRYTLNNQFERIHHDFEVLPNGNILTIVWQRYDEAFLANLGREAKGELWIDSIIELKPEGLNGAERVWEWKFIDHIVQNTNPELPDYGEPKENLERFDINIESAENIKADWNHTNSLDYNPSTGEILLSLHATSEVIVIQHNSDEDILFRMGNPAVSGVDQDRLLYNQHDPTWLDNDRILLFNNGIRGTDRDFSTVDEYRIRENGEFTFNTARLIDRYSREGFFQDFISGAHKKENGETLITEGPDGIARLVDEDGEDIWSYQHKNQDGVPSKIFKYGLYSSELVDSFLQ